MADPIVGSPQINITAFGEEGDPTVIIGPNFGVGQEYKNYIDFRSVVIENSIEVASDAMDFDIWIYEDAIGFPQTGWEIIFEDAGVVIFAGVITKITSVRMPTEGGIIFKCEARDYVYWLNRRLIHKLYPEDFAGIIIKSILTDLYTSTIDVDFPAGDQHYFFFKDNVDEIQDGVEIPDIDFDFVYPSQAFDQISQAIGYTWWIDFNKQVNFKPANVTPTEILPDETLHVDNLDFSGLVIHFDYEEERTIENVGTQLVMRDVTRISLNSITQNFFGISGDNFVLDGDNKLFDLAFDPWAVLYVSSVKKEGVEQDLKPDNSSGFNVEDGLGSSTDVFIFVGNDGNSYVRFAKDNVVEDTDLISVTYRYQIVSDDESGVDEAGQLLMQQLTGGDGIHQFLYAQSSGIKVLDEETLTNLQDTILNRKSKPIRRGSFNTWLKGFEAGMVFTRRWDALGGDDVLETMFIISVTTTIRTPSDADPDFLQNVFLSHIIFASTPHGVAA